MAHRSVSPRRPLTQVRIFDIEAAKAEAFAREIDRDLDVEARAVGHAREAVVGCDLVVTITAAKARVFDGDWLEPGAHVSGAGSNTPNKRELDGTVFRRSKVVVDFKDQALQEAGDLQDAIRTGAITVDAIHAELGQVLTGKKPGRENDREITLFKSVGMAVEDITTASFAYQQALAAGLGTYIESAGVDAARIPAMPLSEVPVK